jgi:prepilin-type N-terminal cleavage/methylation domain-containing protein
VGDAVTKARRRNGGYTLIELMLTVAIISILAGIGIPQFASVMAISQEATTFGNLSTLRSALSIYYGDNNGTYPTTLNALTVNGRYLKQLPLAYLPPHE